MITNSMRFEKFFNTPISIKSKFKIVMIFGKKYTDASYKFKNDGSGV